MSNKKLLIPKKGLKIRDPKTGLHIPEEGVERKLNTFYNRRIADGDLEAKPVSKAKTKPAAKNGEE